MSPLAVLSAGVRYINVHDSVASKPDALARASLARRVCVEESRAVIRHAMKLKQQPEDFQVEELTDIVPAGEGSFALYRLEKRGWATHDALGAICRRWKIEPRRIAYGGLKDRHARTVQYLTIFRGPQRGLKHHDVTLSYLGRIGAPYTSKDIRANRFQIILRGLGPEEVPAAQQALEEVRVDGVPNYFDDQRFGSVGEENRFVARSLILGRYEEALRLAMAEPYRHDRASQKQEKAILREHWRDWARCKSLLPRGHARNIVDCLVSHPEDFRTAVARLRLELRSLYLSAYQGYLWNRILAQALGQFCRPEQLVLIDLRLGKAPLHRLLDEARRAELAHLLLPLPSARLRLDVSDPRTPLIEAVMAEEGLQLSDLKIKAFREPFFSKGERSAVCLPAGLAYEASADERYPGQQKLTLSFDLPRGSYATLIVKRIQNAITLARKSAHQPEAVARGLADADLADASG
jgi:tRNA pseudouridine13 synthase